MHPPNPTSSWGGDYISHWSPSRNQLILSVRSSWLPLDVEWLYQAISITPQISTSKHRSIIIIILICVYLLDTLHRSLILLLEEILFLLLTLLLPWVELHNWCRFLNLDTILERLQILLQFLILTHLIKSLLVLRYHGVSSNSIYMKSHTLEPSYPSRSRMLVPLILNYSRIHHFLYSKRK